MQLQIKELRKKDHRKVIQFTIEGMHFEWYFDHKIPLKLYGRYFWYLELCRATQMIAVYEGQEAAESVCRPCIRSYSPEPVRSDS